MISRLGAAVVGAALVASLTTSCQAGDRDDGDPSPAPSAGSAGPPELPASWSASVTEAPFSTDDVRNEGPNPIDAGEVTVIVGERQVTGLRTDTGGLAWSVSLDDRVCATAPTANPAGIAALLTSAGADGDCTDVVAIDTADGARLWTASLPRSDRAGGHEVSIGADSVVSAGRCNGFTVFAAATGAVVADVPGANVRTVCDSAASDGSRVVFQQGQRLTVVDAATGERTVQTRVAGLGRVGDVVSSDPLVVTAVVEGRGRLVSLAGASPVVLGRESNSLAGEPRASGLAGGAVWMQYADRADRLWGYDPVTGRKLATVDVGDSWLIGGHEGRLVLSTAVDVDGAQRSELRLVDPLRADEPGVVGMLPTAGEGAGGLTSGAVVGDVLVRIRVDGDGGHAEAVRIPAGG